jgi:hypothetical protein
VNTHVFALLDISVFVGDRMGLCVMVLTRRSLFVSTRTQTRPSYWVDDCRFYLLDVFI